MLYNYIAIVLFALLGISIPAGFLFASKLLRRAANLNDVKTAPYESGEKSIGSSRDMDVEYFPFLMLFLPFEVIAILTLLWALVSKTDGRYLGIYFFIMLIAPSALSIIGYKLIGGHDE